MILDPRKVCVIYNTADTSGESQSVAEYYAAARSLGHVLGVDLGLVSTTAYATMAAFRAGALTTIQTYFDTHAIEGAVLSINCPRMVRVQDGATWQSISSMCKVVGNCWDVIATVNHHPRNTIFRSVWSMTDFDGSRDAGFDEFRVYEVSTGYGFDVSGSGAPFPRRADWRTQVNDYGGTKTIPCGRLGLPIGNFTDSSTLAIRCIDDAIWYERNGNPAGSPMMFGLSTRGNVEAHWPLTFGNVAFAYHVLSPLVGAVETYEGNHANSAGSKYDFDNWQFPKPDITITDTVAFLAGNGPAKSIWGWLGTGAENTGTAFTGSVTFERGGWMFESTSSDVSKHSLDVGACSCICPVTEPSTAGVPEIGGLARQLARGMSMMEAELCSGVALFSQSNGQYSEAWGDPLYTPFTRQFIGQDAVPGSFNFGRSL